MRPGRELTRAGLRGVPAVELEFNGCRVPKKAMLGPAGQGHALAQAAVIATAPLAASLSCGLLAEAMDYVLALLRARGPGERPLAEFQPLDLTLADVMARLDSSLAMAWAAAGAIDEGLPAAERLSREAKWIASESAVLGIDAFTRLLGIEASLKNAPLERLSRDARAAQLLLGPNHLHRLEVARKLTRLA
jgi:alkylation response protein AidB-like acyl-CoA dehydrogenase